jgi:hypoxanthine phosphoribosyltransferase
MATLKDTLFPFITQQEISAMISTLAREIEAEYAGEEVILICPLKGSFCFLADLMRELQLSQQVEFVDYKAIRRGGMIQVRLDFQTDLRDRHVLILEEIIDTGRTLNFLRDRILLSDPASVKIVTLLDKPSRRELPIQPDFVGRTVDDRYVVGYGMDSEERGRNYPDIYSLKN